MEFSISRQRQHYQPRINEEILLNKTRLKEMTHKFKIIPPIQGVASVSRTAVSSNDVLFSFKYLVEESYNKCSNSKFFTDLLGRFKKYSTIGWQGIRASGRHQWGMEKTPVGQIKHTAKVECLTPDVKDLHILRSSGDNRVLVGLQEQQVFHIFFIEASFGDISNH